MQTKIELRFLLAIVIFATAHAAEPACKLEGDSTAEAYFCEGVDDLQKALLTVPPTAQRITICNSKIPSLAGNSFTQFGNTLVYLNISSSVLSKIEPGTFSGLTALRDLVLDNNEIKFIKTDWVEDLTNLKTLRLFHNHITGIEEEAFDHLSNLEVLDLAYNKIDHCLSTDSLQKLEELKILYITGNPWPLRCRPPVFFHLENHHIQAVHAWRDSHILIEECLAHEIHAKFNDEVLKKCVERLAAEGISGSPTSL